MTSEMGRRSLTLPKCSHFQRLGLPQCLPMPSWLHKPSFGEIAQAHLQLCPVSQPSGRNPCLIAHPGHTSPGPTATRPYEGSVSVRTRANRTPHLLVSRAHPKGRLARDACRTLDVEVLCQFLGRRGRAISRPVYGAMPRIPGLPCPCSAYPDVRTGWRYTRACVHTEYLRHRNMGRLVFFFECTTLVNACIRLLRLKPLCHGARPPQNGRLGARQQTWMDRTTPGQEVVGESHGFKAS